MRKIAVGKKSVQMAPQFFRVRFTLKTDQNSAPFMILKEGAYEQKVYSFYNYIMRWSKPPKEGCKIIALGTS